MCNLFTSYFQKKYGLPKHEIGKFMYEKHSLKKYCALKIV